MLGVDYSSGRPDPAGIRSAGYGFVCRYLAPLDAGKQSWKELRAAERDAILKAGLPLVLFFESTAKRALEGKNAGRADGRTATQRADELRVPRGVCIYAAIDTDISKRDLAEVDVYFAGFAETLRTDLSVGAYGEYDALDYLFSRRRITHGFQTAAWSGGRVHPRAELYQHAKTVTIDGVSCDVDELLHHGADYGGWRPEGEPELADVMVPTSDNNPHHKPGTLLPLPAYLQELSHEIFAIRSLDQQDIKLDEKDAAAEAKK